MIRKTEKKLQAIKLRKQGKSIKEIAKLLDVSSSTTSLWTRDIKLSAEQKQKLEDKVFESLQRGRIKAQKVQKLSREKVRNILLQKAIKQIGPLSNRDIFIAGASLYWAEGFKKDNRLGFANTDPCMIKFFLNWLTIAGVNKNDIRLRVGLNISHKQRANQVQKYWERLTGIPENQFQKPFFQKFKWKKTFSDPENYFGVLRVRASNQGPLFIMIKEWVNYLRQNQDQ